MLVCLLCLTVFNVNGLTTAAPD